MNDLEYKCDLQDRIAKIQAINEQYDLEHNAYLSFSGGLDSVIVSRLLDMALPNNNIPRVYANTGIEYVKMVKDTWHITIPYIFKECRYEFWSF